MKPVTTALSFPEPARTQALELIAEERMQIGLRAVTNPPPKKGRAAAEAPKSLRVSLRRNRAGKTVWVDIPTYPDPEMVDAETGLAVDESGERVEPPCTKMVADLAIRLLFKYGKGADKTLIDEEGNALRPEHQCWLEEVDLPENDEVVMAVNPDRTLKPWGDLMVLRPSDLADEDEYAGVYTSVL